MAVTPFHKCFPWKINIIINTCHALMKQYTPYTTLLIDLNICKNFIVKIIITWSFFLDLRPPGFETKRSYLQLFDILIQIPLILWTHTTLGNTAKKFQQGSEARIGLYHLQWSRKYNNIDRFFFNVPPTSIVMLRPTSQVWCYGQIAVLVRLHTGLSFWIHAQWSTLCFMFHPISK